MTKDTYYDMCESMNSDPIDEEIPVEFQDFPFEVQLALEIYSLLPTMWDTEHGFYLGRRLEIMPYLFRLHNVEDEKEALCIILIADEINKEIINKKQAAELKKASKKNGK